MGIAPFMQFMARARTPMRTIDEMQAIIDDHNQLMGKPAPIQSKPREAVRPISAELKAKRAAGRRAYDRVGQAAMYESN